MFNMKHPLALVSLLATVPVLTAGVRHSRSLGGTGQAIPRVQPGANAPATPALPNAGQIQPQPIEPANAGPNQYPQQYPGLPQTPISSPMAPPMPVQVPNQNMQRDEEPGMQATPQQVAPLPVAPPPPMPVKPPAAVQQPAPTGTVPVPVQPSYTQEPMPLPMQGQPALPPSPPGTISGDRYLLPTYGMAGCGLGSMIFVNNHRSEQWLASILNDGIFPQSFSISTGTSNCVDADEEQLQAEQEIFVDTNFTALRIDAARGDGESLRAYAELLGCQKEGLYDTFASLSQGQFSFIFSDAQPRSVAERYRDTLKRSRALKTRCDRLF